MAAQTVEAWVGSLDLPASIASTLTENGFEDLSFCEVMLEEDVVLMGIAKEHHEALLAGVKKLVEAVDATPPAGRRMSVVERRQSIASRRSSISLSRRSSSMSSGSSGSPPKPSPRRASMSRPSRPAKPSPARTLAGATVGQSSSDTSPPKTGVKPIMRVKKAGSALFKRLSSAQSIVIEPTLPPPASADFRACDLEMSDEERLKLMGLVRDGKMSVDDAVEKVKKAPPRPAPPASRSTITEDKEAEDAAPAPSPRPRPAARKKDTEPAAATPKKTAYEEDPFGALPAAPTKTLEHVNKLRPKGQGKRRPPTRAALRQNRSGGEKSFNETAGLAVPKAAPRGKPKRPTSSVPKPAAKPRAEPRPKSDPIATPKPAKPAKPTKPSKPEPAAKKPEVSRTPEKAQPVVMRKKALTVETLLEQLGLSEHLEALQENGYDEIEFLPDVSEEELAECISDKKACEAILAAAKSPANIPAIKASLQSPGSPASPAILPRTTSKQRVKSGSPPTAKPKPSSRHSEVKELVELAAETETETDAVEETTEAGKDANSRLSGQCKDKVRQHLKEKEIRLWEQPHSEEEKGASKITKSLVQSVAEACDLDLKDTAVVLEYLRLSSRRKLGLPIPINKKRSIIYAELELVSGSAAPEASNTKSVVYTDVDIDATVDATVA